jgi:hypothetical protein
MGFGFRAGLQKLGQKIGLLSRIEVTEETVKKGVLLCCMEPGLSGKYQRWGD